jgi:predicted DNA-binding transcriptional regulator YafY
MTKHRAERLFHMVNILRTGRGYHASELAEVLGVSVRTIYRDVVDISGQVPIYYDRGYRVLREARLANMAFTRDELLSLKRALEAAGLPLCPYHFPGGLQAALNKINDQLSGRFGHRDATGYKENA